MNVIQGFMPLLIVACLVFCTARAEELTLVGSTPGDREIKAQLGMDPSTAIDFIKWHLTLTDHGSGSKEFVLALRFGLSQPNTTGFINGGTTLSLKGTYSTVTQEIGKTEAQVYRLRSASQAVISFVRIGDNVYHLLSSDNSLMLGNGGWSYSLNKDGAVKTSGNLRSFISTAFAAGDTGTRIIFDSRTPCMEIARDSRLNVSEDCFKLKWKITMERDAQSLLPRHYTIDRTDKRSYPIKGKWSVIKGNTKHPDAIIYRLTPDDGGPIVHLLAGDHNVLFFLDNDLNLFTGNQEHSYTANRRMVK